MTRSGIAPVTLDEVIGLERYEGVREQIRRDIIALKRHRRLAVGDEVTFVFENHATVFFQVQEMLRAERITDVDAIRAELLVYNELLPAAGQLSATMLIEITDQEQIPQRLRRLLGIDEAVRIDIGNDFVIPAEFEPGRSDDEKLSAVQYVRFSLPAPARAAFIAGEVPVHLVIDHPQYHAVAAIDGAVRASLGEDLRVPA